MEPSILQITVLQGPKNGEILVCEPGSTIRIGRVIKGNDMALRDPGVSQKHICFRFVQEESRWFVTDLATSNGTILNESPIQAWVPIAVSDGDVFRIGEKTKLGVSIVTSGLPEEKEEGNNVRRMVKRRGSSLGVNTRANSSRVSEQKEPQSRVPARGRGRGRGRGGGRGRGKVVTRNSAGVLEEEKEDSRDLVTASYPETNESDQNIKPELGRNARRDNSSRALKELDGNCEVDLNLQVKETGTKRKGRGRGKGKASTASEVERVNDENLVLDITSESSDPDYAAIPELRKVKKAKTSANSSIVIEQKEGEEDVRVEEEGVERNIEEAGVSFENMTLEEDARVKEGPESNSGEGMGGSENMTLEEWFDTMEWYLPKVIYEESAKIIEKIREKARKFDELMEEGTQAA